MCLRLRLNEKIENRKRQRERLVSKMDKLDWSRNHLQEERREKRNSSSKHCGGISGSRGSCVSSSGRGAEIESINLAMEVIDGISKDIHRQVGWRLRRRISQILGEITGGKYTEILIDADLHITVNTGERTVALENLSRGTVEQIYFALRMAAGELLCGQEKLPVFLDEVFGMYDEERLSLVLKWLAKENRQVIISSCRQREEEILKKNKISYHKIEL